MFGAFTRRTRAPVADATAQVTVYGTQWCAATQQARRYLDRHGVRYVFRDMDRDMDATSRVEWWTGGYASHPTIQIGGDILVEPTMAELQTALERNGLL